MSTPSAAARAEERHGVRAVTEGAAERRRDHITVPAPRRLESGYEGDAHAVMLPPALS